MAPSAQFTLTTSSTVKKFTEGSAASAVDSLLTLTPIDSVNPASVTSFSIRINGFEEGDTLSFGGNTKLNAVTSDGTGVLTFTFKDSFSSLSASEVQAALRLVKFGSTDQNPTLTKTISYKINGLDMPSSNTINVINVNDAPTVLDADKIISAGTATEGITKTITHADLLGTNQFSDVDSSTINFLIASVDATKGTLYVSKNGAAPIAVVANITLVTAADTLTWVSKNVVTSLTTGNEISAFTIKAKDDSGSATALSPTPVTVKINVTDANIAPILSGKSVATYIEGLNGAGAAVIVDGGLVITELDYTMNGLTKVTQKLTTATVMITGNFQNGDFLDATLTTLTTGDLTKSYNVGTGILTLHSDTGVTAGQMQTALRSVKYSSTNQDQNGGDKAISITVTDMTGGVSESLTTKVIIKAVNDTPVVLDADKIISAGTATEGITKTITHADLLGTNQFSDVDSSTINFLITSVNTTNGTLYVSKNSAAPIAVVANITLVTAADTLTWVSKNVVTSLTSGNEISAFTIKAKDDSGSATALSTTPVTVKINVTDANIAPILSGKTVATYTEGLNGAGTPVAVDGGLVITELDYTMNGLTKVVEKLKSATVTIDDYEVGDTLAATLTAATTGDLAITTNANGTLTLTSLNGVTVGQMQNALRSVKYSSTNQDPNGGDKAISITVTDMTGGVSESLTTKVIIKAVNDAPVVSDGAIMMVETSYTFGVDDFSFTDDEGDGFGGIIIKALPASTNGKLYLDGVALTTIPKTITSEQIATGKLSYKAINPTDVTFKFALKDSQGGVSSDHTFTIAATDLNHAPIFTSPVNSPEMPQVWTDAAGSLSVESVYFRLHGQLDMPPVFSDVDGNLPNEFGMAISNLKIVGGAVLQYSLDNGKTWITPTLPSNGMLLLDQNALIKEGGVNGSSCTYTTRIWDMSDGNTSGTTIINALTGGVSAYSAKSFTHTIKYSSSIPGPDESPDDVTISGGSMNITPSDIPVLPTSGVYKNNAADYNLDRITVDFDAETMNGQPLSLVEGAVNVTIESELVQYKLVTSDSNTIVLARINTDVTEEMNVPANMDDIPLVLTLVQDGTKAIKVPISGTLTIYPTDADGFGDYHEPVSVTFDFAKKTVLMTDIYGNQMISSYTLNTAGDTIIMKSGLEVTNMSIMGTTEGYYVMHEWGMDENDDGFGNLTLAPFDAYFTASTKPFFSYNFLGMDGSGSSVVAPTVTSVGVMSLEATAFDSVSVNATKIQDVDTFNIATYSNDNVSYLFTSSSAGEYSVFDTKVADVSISNGQLTYAPLDTMDHLAADVLMMTNDFMVIGYTAPNPYDGSMIYSIETLANDTVIPTPAAWPVTTGIVTVYSPTANQMTNVYGHQVSIDFDTNKINLTDLNGNVETYDFTMDGNAIVYTDLHFMPGMVEVAEMRMEYITSSNGISIIKQSITPSGGSGAIVIYNSYSDSNVFSTLVTHPLFTHYDTPNDDSIIGTTYSDQFLVSNGNDRMDAGIDSVNDKFVYNPSSNEGMDSIWHFDIAHDTLVLMGNTSTVNLSELNGDTIVTLGGGTVITLVGVSGFSTETNIIDNTSVMPM